MKWINTQDLVSILQRFPNEQVAASAYLGCGISSAHLWSYSAEEKCLLHTMDEKCFRHTIATKSRCYSEVELYRLYGDYHWKVEPSFYLRDDHEAQIAVRLVEELGTLGRLEDMISESELDNVRVCEHCHHLMDEGWLVDDIRTFCSDECLRSAYPKIDMDELQAHALDSDCRAYWTRWE